MLHSRIILKVILQLQTTTVRICYYPPYLSCQFGINNKGIYLGELNTLPNKCLGLRFIVKVRSPFCLFALGYIYLVVNDT
jgi:hypothetical protein